MKNDFPPRKDGRLIRAARIRAAIPPKPEMQRSARAFCVGLSQDPAVTGRARGRKFTPQRARRHIARRSVWESAICLLARIRAGGPTGIPSPVAAWGPAWPRPIRAVARRIIQYDRRAFSRPPPVLADSRFQYAPRGCGGAQRMWPWPCGLGVGVSRRNMPRSCNAALGAAGVHRRSRFQRLLRMCHRRSPDLRSCQLPPLQSRHTSTANHRHRRGHAPPAKQQDPLRRTPRFRHGMSHRPWAGAQLAESFQ